MAEDIRMKALFQSLLLLVLSFNICRYSIMEITVALCFNPYCYWSYLFNKDGEWISKQNVCEITFQSLLLLVLSFNFANNIEIKGNKIIVRDSILIVTGPIF